MVDADIRQRLAYGDHNALAEVYDSHGATVYAVALSVTGDPAVAEDITVDTFLSLWSRPLAYDPAQARLYCWMAMLAHRHAVEWLRHNSTVPDHRNGANRPVAMAVLPELTRQAIDLAYFNGRTYQQIAIELGIPAGTAKARLRAGLRELAAKR
nr:sigma factor-like helix-turn-helix DNA-binding protein [Kibdelosporangium sp. MJ126-NF4]CEL15098.1 RNA polymerase sigma-70 factor [Kibdelosporangium sp. MJ126-NF4]CTQ93308.1 RNA polymerase sigma-70 factor [Kibdelosporangium sp. MJ126-NF4]